MVGYGVVFGSVPVGRLLGKDREKNCPAWQHNVVNRRAGNRSCSVNESEVDFFLFYYNSTASCNAYLMWKR